MLELEIKNLTAAITRLADLMEAGTAPTETWDGPVVDQAPAVTPAPAPAPVDLVAMRQQAQDTCLETVRANRDNKATIATGSQSTMPRPSSNWMTNTYRRSSPF
jgi:hypothetical protein